MANLPHPVQYQGSKRSLATHILRFLPNHIERLVEPFAGTAAISIAAAAQQSAQNFWLNDLNQPLVKLFELIIEHPQDLADAYLDIWSEQHSDSIGHYFEVRKKFNQTNDPNLFLYLLARCVKGAVRYNSEGLFNQSPDKRRKGTQPETMRKNIEGVSRLLKGKCQFTSLDYKQVLTKAQSNDFVYMDPPYQGVCGNKDSRYFAGIDFEDFVLALEHLNERGIAFAISYDGRLGNKTFGRLLPESLRLKRIEIEVGRSSQSTLLGRAETTIESLYLSPDLVSQQFADLKRYISKSPKQLTLQEKHEHFSTATR
ncbi:Dam family site-specific DNA-(adenine-N6)-methyltransferase [Chamaesiphon polymorphus]|uniref:Site-specific DNA-methyltransferase (adenine-specific) n=1 Tax=Chamaesiphon polymorphus CCALA 037 TaxID=2107692 RepID=A0A2T1GF38_9CYAN|nr:DNA adenine methylase [Chamaesiphon polymorphus]PSB56185.1 DNA adenine methylase [Chamaesiphon polymorphus CCALA 037]